LSQLKINIFFILKHVAFAFKIQRLHALLEFLFKSYFLKNNKITRKKFVIVSSSYLGYSKMALFFYALPGFTSPNNTKLSNIVR